MTPDEIQSLITQSGLSIRAVAREIGVDEKTVRHWLRGERAPKPEQLTALRRVCADPTKGALSGGTMALATLPIYREPSPLPILLPISDLRIMSNDRAVFIGPPGVGKSTHAAGMIHVVEDQTAVVLDSKPSPMLETLLPDFMLTDVFRPDIRKQIIRAPAGMMNGDKAWQPFWDTQCAAIYAAGNCLVYVDELMNLCHGRTLNRGLRQLIAQGREKNIGVWAAVTTLRNIPGEPLDYAEHLFVFLINNTDHRIWLAERVAGRLDANIEPEIPTEKHAFLYVNLDAGKHVSCDPEGQAIPARATPAVSPTPTHARATQSEEPSAVVLAEIRSGVVRGAYPAAIGAEVGTDADTVRRIVARHFTGTDEEERWLTSHAPDIPRKKVSVRARSVEPSTSREMVEISRQKLDELFQKREDRGVREGRKQERAAKKLLAAQTGGKTSRTTAKKGNNRTNATESNSRPTSREEEITRSALANLDAMTDRYMARPMQTWSTPAPANGHTVQPSSPALPSADSPDSGLELYPEDATGRRLQTTTQIEQSSSQSSRRPRFFGRRQPDARPAWPFPEIDPEGLEGIRLRTGNRIPGWELE